MKTMTRVLASALLALAFAATAVATAADAPSRTGIDAPELAALGKHAVGVRSITLVDRDQVDLGAIDPQTGIPAKRDRDLKVEIWYPARTVAGATPATYEDAMESEPPAPPSKFKLPGLAVRDAKPDGGRFPLVIVSHGYGNVPVAMSWLAENLASKGYVVAAIRHEDMYLNPAGFPQAALRRPLDIAFVARELQDSLGKSGEVDPARTALIGYSMGGYGVLAAAGASLDPAGGLVSTRSGWVAAALRARRRAERVTRRAESSERSSRSRRRAARSVRSARTGIADIKSPLLLIAGDHDLTVDYTSGARAYFDQAVHSNRYLLTFLGGGHALGLGPAPPEMRTDLWNQDWFEDPVWRKDRLVSISLHFITAFLDRYVKDDASRSAYIDGLVVESSSGTWDAPKGTPWNARSPGGDVTLWKGFQRRHATGLSLMHQDAAPAQ